jgi:hypothetical protein
MRQYEARCVRAVELTVISASHPLDPADRVADPSRREKTCLPSVGEGLTRPAIAFKVPPSSGDTAAGRNSRWFYHRPLTKVKGLHGARSGIRDPDAVLRKRPALGFSNRTHTQNLSVIDCRPSVDS